MKLGMQESVMLVKDEGSLRESSCSLRGRDRIPCTLAGIVLLQDLRVSYGPGCAACAEGRSEASQEALLWRRRSLRLCSRL